MSFSSDIKRFSDKTIRNNSKIVRKIVIDMGTSLVLKTAVGNPSLWQSPAPPGYAGGSARANWQYGVGEMPSGILKSVDSGGNNTINKLTGQVNASNPASIHWISNNLPYIERLENGWSTQSPQGMLKLTVLDFKQTVEDAVKQLK